MYEYFCSSKFSAPEASVLQGPQFCQDSVKEGSAAFAQLDRRTSTATEKKTQTKPLFCLLSPCTGELPLCRFGTEVATKHPSGRTGGAPQPSGAGYLGTRGTAPALGQHSPGEAIRGGPGHSGEPRAGPPLTSHRAPATTRPNGGCRGRAAAQRGRAAAGQAPPQGGLRRAAGQRGGRP